MNRKIKERVLLSMVFPLADQVIHTRAMYWYNEITKMNSWSSNQIKDWQNRRLNSLMHHVFDHTVFYRQVMLERGLGPDDFQSIDDLQKLPIINKQVINEHHQEFIPDNINNFHYRSGKTGGTTGTPMHYLCDENVWGYVTAAKIVAWQTVGYRYGDKFVALGSSSLFPNEKTTMIKTIYNKLRNEVPLNSVQLNDDLCEKYLCLINHQKISFLYGYAGSLYMLANYVLKHHFTFNHKIKSVFTTSEILTSHYREVIEDAFNCSVMDCYGAKDAGMSAYEIDKGNYFVGYNALSEVIDPLADGTGSLVTTNLLNYTFPLIRYDFGDVVKLTEDESIYNGQLITNVVGRTNDIIKLKNGHQLSATGFSMILKKFDIVAFEVHQVDNCHLDLLIQPIPHKYTKEQQQDIFETISHYIGSDMCLNIKIVDKFEELANGKKRYLYID